MHAKSDQKKRDNGNAQWICGKRVEQESSNESQRGDRENSQRQTGINHQRRKQIDLRAKKISKPFDGGLEKDRDKCREQNDGGR